MPTAQETRRLAEVGAEIREHLAEIETLFVPGMKLTLLVRDPRFPDASRDMVITNDQISAAILALTKREA